MLVHLLVERGQDVCIVKLAGKQYKFERNEHGHLVTDVIDQSTIEWVSDPRNTSFLPYKPPKPKVIEEPVVSDGEVSFQDEVTVDQAQEEEPVHEQETVDDPQPGPTESDPSPPPVKEKRVTPKTSPRGGRRPKMKEKK